MDIKAKIIFSLFFIGGFFLLKFAFPIIPKMLKARLQIVNPELVKRAPWFFEIHKKLIPFIGVMILVFLIMLWSGLLDELAP